MSTQFPKVGVGVVIIQHDKIFLAKRKGSYGAGTWGSVGGHVDFGEKPSDALKREVKEEVGIELKNIQFLCCANIMCEGKHYLDVGFVADIKKGVPSVQSNEKTELAKRAGLI